MRRRNAVLAWALSVAIAVTFMPVMGGAVYADDGGVTYVKEDVALPAAQVEANKAKAKAKLDAQMGVAGAKAGEPAAASDAAALNTTGAAAARQAAAEAKPIAVYDPEKFPITCRAPASVQKEVGLSEEGEPQVFPGEITITGPDSNGEILVTGSDISATGLRYMGITISDDVDSFETSEDVMELTGEDQTVFRKTIDMTEYSIGLHSIYVVYTDGTNSGYLESDYIPTPVLIKARNQLSNYFTGISYFDYRYPGGDYEYYDSGEADVFMDYRKSSAKEWCEDVYLLPDLDTNYTISKLPANTAYKVRMMYGKAITYDGMDLAVTGRLNGMTSNPQTIKTAYKKPAVKSIKITNGKVKVKKWKVHYANRYYYRVNRRTGARKLIKVKKLYRVYKSAYTKFKVTVNFKKKQGVAGVYITTIHGLYALKNGDKKSYSQTFTVPGKKKGKKVKVMVQSYRSKTYGGYSGTYSKKVKVK